MEAEPKLCKIILLGNLGAGKTSLLDAFMAGQEMRPHVHKELQWTARRTRHETSGLLLDIWDTNGHEIFIGMQYSLPSEYYSGAAAAIIVYDSTSLDSFLGVDHWYLELKRRFKGVIAILLVGCKSELASQKVVDQERAAAYAAARGLLFCETTDTPCDHHRELFDKLVEAVQDPPQIILHLDLHRGNGPDRSDMVRVTARSIAGNQVAVAALDPWKDDVRSLTLQLAEQTGKHPKLHRLFFNGNPLQESDHMTLGQVFRGRNCGESTPKDLGIQLAARVSRSRSKAAQQAHVPEAELTDSNSSDESEVWEGGADSSLRTPLPRLPCIGAGRQIQADPTIVTFVGVDGVLHPSKGRKMFSCMPAFEQIVRGCNASVVLTCKWRLKPHRKIAVNDALRKRGLAGIHDVTPDLSHSTFRKEDEVLDWLCRHPEVQHWLVIDDADVASDRSPHRSMMKHHFLKVNSNTGLNPYADVHKALQLMPRERGDVELFWSVRPVDKSLAPTYPGARPLSRGGSKPFMIRRY
eukprot:TRINITY_DN23230_c0_g1_i1.p1 TRINITY_DN23230_c0_g1~~TRINITY_DN23230_c0_g1_i1.p1  ORF type:complete len:523 (-),score=80.15 TRINITY_DN23230_c0_g1_i1:28-1596(-)